MPSITDLPCEIMGEILRKLDHLRDLSSTILACRHFYNSFVEFPGLEASVLRRQITPALVPYAIAAMDARRLPRDSEVDPVLNLLDQLYDQPATLADRLMTLRTPLLRELSDYHDTIRAVVTAFASFALERLLAQSASTSVALLPTEYFCFCSSFYSLELFNIMLWQRNIVRNKDRPWENEQLACAYEQLAFDYVGRRAKLLEG
ncbi:uncharacterized protein B0T15DRAFT_260036 [Chaetomium strumarium]|uniref:F-box domain-containing protein n=1 Tax=Chaetomium strumarium TaxID=1170767 RepID=A0AAJ0GN36_9PEZI|nr:hypothetical protein B0T15DRAFT_260036 [Chaetomium strumarium]